MMAPSYQRLSNLPSPRSIAAVADYCAGMSASAIARKYGVSRQRVYQWLDRAGTPSHQGRERIADAQAEVVERVRRGERLGDAIRECGIGEKCARKALQRHGISARAQEMKRRADAARPLWEAAAREYLGGRTAVAVAADYGRARHWVYRAVRRLHGRADRPWSRKISPLGAGM